MRNEENHLYFQINTIKLKTIIIASSLKVLYRMLLRGLKYQRFPPILLANCYALTSGLQQFGLDLRHANYLNRDKTVSRNTTLFKGFSVRTSHTYKRGLSTTVNGSLKADTVDSTESKSEDIQKPNLNSDFTHIISSLRKKQNISYLHQHFSTILPHNDIMFAQVTSDLECFLCCLPSLLELNPSPCSSDNSLQFSKTRRLSYNMDIESAFVILLQSLVMALKPSYKNNLVTKLLVQFSKVRQDSEYTDITADTFHGALFNEMQSKILFENENFKIALRLLKFEIEEEMVWNHHGSYAHDVNAWISSIFEPSLTKCISYLNGCDVIPDIILYDLLLRKPENELEYIALYELYAKHSKFINFKDQELLYSLKQFNTKSDKALARGLKIPLVFSNLLCYAIRFKVAFLPKLMTLFLDENNTRTPQIIDQLGEIMWKLSYDHTGKNSILPSDFYRFAQSKIIKVLNSFISENKDFDPDCTNLLAVSNLTYFHDFQKAYKYFKSAQKRFDRWQLESFDIEGLKKVVRASQKYPDNTHSNKIAQLRYQRMDYNAKFLCNSILLLDIQKSNWKDMFNDFYCILNKADRSLLRIYPEIWDIILIKMNHHSMLNYSTIGILISLYLRTFKGHIYNSVVLDLIISHTDDPIRLLQIYTRFQSKEMDDSTLSKFISKLYKLAKNGQALKTVQENSQPVDILRHPEKLEKLSENCSDIESFNYLIQHYQEVVIPQKLSKVRKQLYEPEEFKVYGFGTPLEFARYLYQNAPFKSSRLNSSYLLGESTLNPENAYARYESLNAYTKVTPLTISSLFVAALSMQKNKKYNSVRWVVMDSHGTENKKPVDVAFEEFDKRISESFGDCVTGKVYPNDNLLVLYLQCAKKFGKSDRLYSFLKRMVDLRYPMKSGLFHTYISMLPAADRAELVYALGAYDKRFKAFRKCSSEYELDQLKSTMKPIRISGRFADFVSKFDFTWGRVGKWDWPGK